MEIDDRSLAWERDMRLGEALEAADRENAELSEQLAQAAAERDATRARPRGAAADGEAQRGLYIELLAVVDELEDIRRLVPPQDPMAPRIEALHRSVLGILRGEGIAPVEVMIGAPFDPATQEEAGTRHSVLREHAVAQLLRNGYTLHGQVLRPARVVVAHPGVVPHGSD